MVPRAGAASRECVEFVAVVTHVYGRVFATSRASCFRLPPQEATERSEPRLVVLMFLRIIV